MDFFSNNLESVGCTGVNWLNICPSSERSLVASDSSLLSSPGTSLTPSSLLSGGPFLLTALALLVSSEGRLDLSFETFSSPFWPMLSSWMFLVSLSKVTVTTKLNKFDARTAMSIASSQTPLNEPTTRAAMTLDTREIIFNRAVVFARTSVGMSSAAPR
ncbi:unnamed protein product [Haemonchus placei]|uniref:Uncharacterized protein n=1 Tax=Haemonchus placei TaxID=6290 RepID=A0A3P8B1L4_HAEPC|nr:unnamed protein product [Haemonchus placei]